jgi:hypothetical protein
MLSRLELTADHQEDRHKIPFEISLCRLDFLNMRKVWRGSATSTLRPGQCHLDGLGMSM